MDNINKFPARLFQMNKIPIRDMAFASSNATIRAGLMGSDRPVLGAVSDDGDARLTVTTLANTFLPGELVTISGTAGPYDGLGGTTNKYDGTFLLTTGLATRTRLYLCTLDGSRAVFCGTLTGYGDAVAVEPGYWRDITITDYSATVAGTVLVTSPGHRFQTGDLVDIVARNANYDGQQTITKIDADTFYFSATYDANATGKAKYGSQELIYSPLDGLPSIKCVDERGSTTASVFGWTSVDDLTFYPNSAMVIQTAGWLGEASDYPAWASGIYRSGSRVSHGGLYWTANKDTTQEPTGTPTDWDEQVLGSIIPYTPGSGELLRPPVLLITEKTDPAEARQCAYSTPTFLYAGGLTDKWRIAGVVPCNGYQVRNSLEAPKAWCSTTENQAFETKTVAIEYPSSAKTKNPVFYLGGIVTENIPKAKLIIGFDSIHAPGYANAAQKMMARGWRGVLYTWSQTHDNAEYKTRIQACYDKGWDVCNHSSQHRTADANRTEQELIEDLLTAKAWQLSNNWPRGADFISYPGVVMQAQNNGADLIDPYFLAGRGQGYRKTFYDASHGFAGGPGPLLPVDMMNLNHRAATAGSNTDYAASTVKSDLDAAVKGQSVYQVYIHDINADPDELQNSVAWWDAFEADVAAKVAAGQLEIITMTDYYNELYGIEKHTRRAAGSGLFVQTG